MFEQATTDTTAGGARVHRDLLDVQVPVHDVSYGPDRILRTDDGGLTWQETGSDLTSSNLGLPSTLGRDGELLISEGDGLRTYTWISRDDGRHFTRGTDAPPGVVGAAPGRVWVVAGGQAWITGDGRSWRSMRLPW